MPAIRSSRIGPEGLTITAPDERIAVVTSTDILSRYASEGSYSNVQAWIAAEVESQLGSEFITASMLSIQFDTSTGEVTGLEVTDPWLY